MKNSLMALLILGSFTIEASTEELPKRSDYAGFIACSRATRSLYEKVIAMECSSTIKSGYSYKGDSFKHLLGEEFPPVRKYHSKAVLEPLSKYNREGGFAYDINFISSKRSSSFYIVSKDEAYKFKIPVGHELQVEEKNNDKHYNVKIQLKNGIYHLNILTNPLLSPMVGVFPDIPEFLEKMDFTIPEGGVIQDENEKDFLVEAIKTQLEDLKFEIVHIPEDNSIGYCLYNVPTDLLNECKIVNQGDADIIREVDLINYKLDKIRKARESNVE